MRVYIVTTVKEKKLVFSGVGVVFSISRGET